MRFIDANVFIYAFYKPKKTPDLRSLALKELSKSIIKNIQRGEEVLTTVIHLSEVANIIKHSLPEHEVCTIITTLFTMDNIEIVDVSKELYLKAAVLGQTLNLNPNDALTVLVMRERNITEIYTFDTDFDNVQGIRRIPSESEIKRKMNELATKSK